MTPLRSALLAALALFLICPALPHATADDGEPVLLAAKGRKGKAGKGKAGKGKAGKGKAGVDEQDRSVRPEWRPRTEAAMVAYNRAVDALNGGDPAKALELATEALQIQPDFGMALTLQGEAFMRQQRIPEAAAALERAAALFESRAEPWTLLSSAWFVGEDFPASRRAAEQGLSHRPESVELLEALQWALVRMGEYEAALARIEARRARGDRPDLACLEVLVRVEMEQLDVASAMVSDCEAGGTDRLVTNAKRRIAGEEVDHREQARRLDALGVETAGPFGAMLSAFEAGRYAEAVDHGTEVLAASPSDLGVLVFRAQALSLLGRDAEALADLEQALGEDDWIRMTQDGGMAGALTRRDADGVRRTLADGAALMVVLLARVGRLDEADARLGQATKAFGQTSELTAAESRLALARAGADGDDWQPIADLLLSRPGDLVIEDQAAGMVFKDGASAPDAVLEPLKRSTDPVVLHNVAAGLSNALRWRGCLDFVNLLLAEADTVAAAPPESAGARPPGSADGTRTDAAPAGQWPEVLEMALPLGYQCAIGADRHRTADSLLARLGGPTAADPNLLLRHAWSAYSPGQRYPRALQLLVDGGLYDKLPRDAEALAIYIYADVQNWAPGIALADKEHAEPTAVAWLGTALAMAGQDGHAERLLAKACAQLDGPAAESCWHNLGLLRE